MKITFLGKNNFFPVYKSHLEKAGHKLVDISDSPDLGVIAYYGKIIPKKELEVPKNGFINIHPSLLPKYRGPSPVRTALYNGDEKTGVTIHITREKVDAGEILAQKEFEILPEENYESLENRLFEEGAKLLPATIKDWISGKIVPKMQDEAQATYTKMVRTEDGKIDWSKTPEEIINQIRAYSPNPGTFSFLDGKRLLILSGSAENKQHQMAPGEIEKSDSGFAIAAKNGFLIPARVKLEGRKEMDAKSFANGYKQLGGLTAK